VKAVRFLRVILRDAFPRVVDRVTAAGTLGLLGLSLAGVSTPDVPHLVIASWGAGGAVYALLVWCSAPDDPDQPPV